MMQIFLRHRCIELLQRSRLICFLHSRSFYTDEYEQLYANQLRKCTEYSKIQHGRAIHANLIKFSIRSSIYIYNHLLNMYVKTGQLSDGLKLFEKMPQRNVVSWTAIISGFVQRGRHGHALSLFSEMHHSGLVFPNEFTLVSTLQACSLSQDLVHLYQVYAYIVRLGFECNVYLTNAFLTGLIRHGKLVEAKGVFDQCRGRDIVSWNAMMAGFLQHSYLEVPYFWYRMSCCEGVKGDNFTFATVLTGLAALSDLKLGLQVHAQVVKSGHGDEMCVGNSLTDMYLKSGMVEGGYRAFREMPCKDVCSWTQMSAGLLQYGEPSEALQFVAEMREGGLLPNKFTLATVLNACSQLASLEEGKKVHGWRIKLSSQVDVCVDNALLDMYVKCGCMDEARVVFFSMPVRSVVSWTTMIMGCAQNGKAREALEIFEDMRTAGVEPNNITFTGVLYACSQGGFVEEGWKYFKSMSSDHGISPGEDHYACMVNLMGRAGHIKEAEELILGMQFQPGVLVWQTLLSACQLHGDMETGKRAAQHAMDVDEKDPSTYVLLSNLFAGQSNWDRVGMLRKLMQNKEVRKMPGSSWIEMEK